jgi:cation diffusion facilitator CzcD-associated flavoprotein CzcO
VIGAGQAGLAYSYWLARLGVEHQMLERRAALGGAWQDRWDSFYLNTPNFSFMLPGLTYDGPEPDAFLPRDAVIDLFRDYAASQSAGRQFRVHDERTRREPRNRLLTAVWGRSNLPSSRAVTR